MECRAYGICLDSQSRGYLGKDRKVSSAAGGNLSRMHKTQETAKESRLNFMYSHLRNRTLVPLRFPFLIDLHADPFERAPEESGGYERWSIDHAYVLVPAQAIVVKFLQSFKEFPPRQKPASFSVDQALKAMQMGND